MPTDRPSAHTTTGAARPGLWSPPADPQRDRQAEQLWALTRAQREAAMYNGRLSFAQCMMWARRRPHEVPTLNGEWWFIAIRTPEAADD